MHGSLTLNVNPIQRFRDDKNHLPINYNAKKARNNNANASPVTGDEHMKMILEQMKKVDYDKYHKPYPDTNLDLSINIFIDTIQGIISEYLVRNDSGPTNARSKLIFELIERTGLV